MIHFNIIFDAKSIFDFILPGFVSYNVKNEIVWDEIPKSYMN